MYRFVRLFLVLSLCLTVFPTLGSTIDDEEEAVFELVNQQRQKAGRSRLKWDESAARLAREYSKRMAREGFFDHYDPQGNSVMDRAERGGLKRWRRIGENLFVGDPTDDLADFAVNGWLRSTTHRENLFDRGWTSTGIGIAHSRDGEIFITQVFLER